MPFSIQTITGEIAATGILRTNKFDINFTPPPGMLNDGLSTGQNGTSTQNFSSLNGVDKNINLYGENANIPGIAMNIAPVSRFGYGPVEKKPFSPLFNDATFIFRSDAYGLVWKYLQTWFRLVVNYQNTNGPNAETGVLPNQHPYELAYKNDYASDITVTVYNDVGTPTLVTVLRQAYPIFIGDIQLAWDDKNNYVKIPTTFTYMDWYQVDPEPIMAGANPQTPV